MKKSKQWELVKYFKFLSFYFMHRGYSWFKRFELIKDLLVDVLYKNRGKYTKSFSHFGTVALIFLMITFGPLVMSGAEEREFEITAGPVLNTVSAAAPDFYTLQAEEVRQYRGGEVIVHAVAEEETIDDIASRYGLQPSTILWANKLTKSSKIKPGLELNILPINGVRHKVSRGETIYTIGKKYGLDGSQVQVIVDYPFNEFLNDETFELASGQYIMIPDGIMPSATFEERASIIASYTPDAGSVSAIGTFIWPASGKISQGYRFYHKAIDIANSSAGNILAADAGVVLTAGWPDGYGYGNRVLIDHGNGFQTLYAHLSLVQVKVGQKVNRGDVVGQMGNTGRSTGTHLHFEIRKDGTLQSPSAYLR
jgi:murein DD-endopeptidase MepM/ murein hydrolase activator NlpD